MSEIVTVVFVAHTGHVLSAVTRTDQPAGDDKEKENKILEANGVIVRSIQPTVKMTMSPAPSKLRNQGRYVSTHLPVILPGGLFSQLGTSVLSYSATLDNNSPLPAWIVVDPATGNLTLTPQVADKGKNVIRIKATHISGQSDYVDFTLIIAESTDPPVVLNPITNITAHAGQLFQLDLPDDTFFPRDNLTYNAPPIGNPNALPVWLHFGGQKPTFSGTPSTNDVGTTTISIPCNVAAGAEFKIAIESPQKSSLEFLVEAEYLQVIDDELAEPSLLLSQPRSYAVKDKKKIVRLPETSSLPSLKYEIDKTGMLVETGIPAIDDLPVWVIVRKGENISVASGTIDKNSRSTTIGFTLDPNARFDVLLLVAEYPPFQSQELRFNQPVLWSPPSS